MPRELDFSVIATLRHPTSRGRKIQNLIGKKFSRITPLGFLGLGNHGAKWLCRCGCGEFCIVDVSKLISGHTKSCGCYKIEALVLRRRTHGETKTRLFRLYSDMHTRCYNPNTTRYLDYGGRGIKVCERWHKFENFRDDVGQPPSPDHQIDRHPDNNGNYGPDNFRWATRTEQARNKRNNRLITHNGETKCLAEWSEITGLSEWIITDSLNRGETLEVLLSKPTRNEQRARYLTINGETHRISEWAKLRGIPSYKIRRNLDRYSMTPEEALGFKERSV